MDGPADATGVRAPARVNLAAMERNIARLAKDLAPAVAICAVVKGDGYGHGAVETARTVLAAGATRLAVSTALEATQLRDAGVQAAVLVMGALSGSELDLALAVRAEIVVWDERFVRAVAARGGGAVHVLLDTGMGTVGVRGPEATRAMAALVDGTDGARLAGVMTQFATADDLDRGPFAEHLRRFEAWTRPLKASHPSLVLHAANSPAALCDPASHFDMVRVGDIIYGSTRSARIPRCATSSLRSSCPPTSPRSEPSRSGSAWATAAGSWHARRRISQACRSGTAMAWDAR